MEGNQHEWSDALYAMYGKAMCAAQDLERAVRLYAIGRLFVEDPELQALPRAERDLGEWTDEEWDAEEAAEEIAVARARKLDHWSLERLMKKYGVPEPLIDELELARDERNYLAHEFWSSVREADAIELELDDRYPEDFFQYVCFAPSEAMIFLAELRDRFATLAYWMVRLDREATGSEPCNAHLLTVEERGLTPKLPWSAASVTTSDATPSTAQVQAAVRAVLGAEAGLWLREVCERVRRLLPGRVATEQVRRYLWEATGRPQSLVERAHGRYWLRSPR